MQPLATQNNDSYLLKLKWSILSQNKPTGQTVIRQAIRWDGWAGGRVLLHSDHHTSLYRDFWLCWLFWVRVIPIAHSQHPQWLWDTYACPDLYLESPVRFISKIHSWLTQTPLTLGGSHIPRCLYKKKTTERTLEAQVQARNVHYKVMQGDFFWEPQSYSVTSGPCILFLLEATDGF